MGQHQIVSQKLLDLIHHHADEITNNWLKDIKTNETTPTYAAFDQKKLYTRAYRVYSNLGKWISRETTKEDIRHTYFELGRKRYQEGFPLSEVIQAFALTRRHLWLKVLHEGLLNTAMDLIEALELNNRVVLFFDRAVFYAAQGYEEACREACKD
ncbi:MAG TPA: histidine kinase N-terminal domain-containing protein [bacterium]|nr:histidine kinase N-terminal domain-containing protein [bacterium]